MIAGRERFCLADDVGIALPRRARGIEHADLDAARDECGGDVLQSEQRRTERSGLGGLTSSTRVIAGKHLRAPERAQAPQLHFGPARETVAPMKRRARRYRRREEEEVEREQEPQPLADDRVVPPPRATLSAARAAGELGNRGFGNALEAGHDIPKDQQPAHFAALYLPGAKLPASIKNVAGDVQQAAATGTKLDSAAVKHRAEVIARQLLTHWSAAARMVEVSVNGPVGTGGRLVGPPLTPLLRVLAGPASSAEAALAAKALEDFATALDVWSATLQVPGLPLWPAFAAIPAPVAAPMPSLPMPLAAFRPQPLIVRPTPTGDPAQDEVLKAVARALQELFEHWKMGKMVTGLMASGPVPVFAPPYVPVGPVVGGRAQSWAGAIH